MRPALTVLGSINRDLVAHTARAPRPGETVTGGELVRLAGGTGANQAVAAQRLGAQVRMLGAVGDDADGRDLVATLSGVGVDVSGIQIAAQPTGTALIVVDAVGQNSIVVCPGANHGIDAARLVIEPAGALLAQLEVPVDVVADAADRTTGLVALNVSPAHQLPARLARRVDLCIVNETELEEVPELRDAPLLALTLGEAGAVLYRHGREIACARVTADRVVNTVGAGDAFAAALVVGILRGDDEARALERACAVGAAAVGDPASQPVLGPLEDYGSR